LNWNSALQGEKLADKLWKVDKKPGVMFFALFALLIFWLFVIHWVHHRDDPNHLVSKSTWHQQMLNTGRQGNGGQEPEQMPPQQAASQQALMQQAVPQPASVAAEGSAAPAAFGSPMPAYQPAPAAAPMANNRIYSAQYATPFNRGSAAQYGAGQPGAAQYGGAQYGGGGYGAQNQQTYRAPAQQYPAPRYKMVVSR
jgi:hypothetical protein